MKKILFTSFITLIITSQSFAMKLSPYTSIKAGYNMTSLSADNQPDEDGNGFLLGASIGTELYNDPMFAIRAEVEYNYITAYDISEMDLNNNTVLANVFADIKLDSKIVPYVGLGIGYGWTTIKDDNIKNDDNNMAWQLGIGISYKAMEKLIFDLGYKYLNNTTFKFKANAEEINKDISSHQIYLGLRYNF